MQGEGERESGKQRDDEVELRYEIVVLCYHILLFIFCYFYSMLRHTFSKRALCGFVNSLIQCCCVCFFRSPHLIALAPRTSEFPCELFCFCLTAIIICCRFCCVVRVSVCVCAVLLRAIVSGSVYLYILIYIQSYESLKYAFGNWQ